MKYNIKFTISKNKKTENKLEVFDLKSDQQHERESAIRKKYPKYKVEILRYRQTESGAMKEIGEGE